MQQETNKGSAVSGPLAIADGANVQESFDTGHMTGSAAIRLWFDQLIERGQSKLNLTQSSPTYTVCLTVSA